MFGVLERKIDHRKHRQKQTAEQMIEKRTKNSAHGSSVTSERIRGGK